MHATSFPPYPINLLISFSATAPDGRPTGLSLLNRRRVCSFRHLLLSSTDFGITGAYLSLIGAHTTLSIYIAALQDHVGRPTEAAVLQACLFAGLQTCRVAIAGRDELAYIVNNAALMVAYGEYSLLSDHFDFLLQRVQCL